LQKPTGEEAEIIRSEAYVEDDNEEYGF